MIDAEIIFPPFKSKGVSSLQFDPGMSPGPVGVVQGTCGECKMKIKNSKGKVDSILACMTKITEDIEVSIPLESIGTNICINDIKTGEEKLNVKSPPINKTYHRLPIPNLDGCHRLEPIRTMDPGCQWLDAVSCWHGV